MGSVVQGSVIHGSVVHGLGVEKVLFVHVWVFYQISRMLNEVVAVSHNGHQSEGKCQRGGKCDRGGKYDRGGSVKEGESVTEGKV